MKAKAKGSIKKRLIIDTALYLFARDGVQNVSFQKIADHAGLKQTSVIYHYKNKDELLVNAIESTLGRSSELIRKLSGPTDSAYKRLCNHFKGNLEWVSQYPNEASIFILLYYEASTNKKMALLYSKLIKNIRIKYQEYLYAGIREKIFDIQEDEVEMLSEVIHEQLMGILINYVTLKDVTKEYLIKKWEISIKKLL